MAPVEEAIGEGASGGAAVVYLAENFKARKKYLPGVAEEASIPGLLSLPHAPVIPPVRDMGQHERVLQSNLGGLASTAAATEPALEGAAAEETIGEEASGEAAVVEVAVEEDTHPEDVEETAEVEEVEEAIGEAVSISHRDLGSVVAKVLGNVGDEGVYPGPVDNSSGGGEGEADAGGPPADPHDPQDTESESENLQPGDGMDEDGYSSLVSTEAHQKHVKVHGWEEEPGAERKAAVR